MVHLLLGTAYSGYAGTGLDYLLVSLTPNHARQLLEYNGNMMHAQQLNRVFMFTFIPTEDSARTTFISERQLTNHLPDLELQPLLDDYYRGDLVIELMDMEAAVVRQHTDEIDYNLRLQVFGDGVNWCAEPACFDDDEFASVETVSISVDLLNAIFREQPMHTWVVDRDLPVDGS